MRQTYPVLEIIIVDDASSPPITFDVLGISDPRIRIVRLEKNVGAAGARWAGVDVAQGELIAFLDADDYWYEEKLEAQVDHLAQHSSDDELVATVCGWHMQRGMEPAPSSYVPVGSSSLRDFVSGCWFAPGSTLLIPRSVLYTVGPFDRSLRRLEDFEWFIRFALAGGQLLSTPVIGAWIRHGRRARWSEVDAAASTILRRFQKKAGYQFDRAVWRRLRAWLCVERAVAARNEGAWVTMAYQLALSFVLVPRISLHLNKWWMHEALPRIDRPIPFERAHQ